jgi:all-trans-retinol 13,14-reductase
MLQVQVSRRQVAQTAGIAAAVVSLAQVHKLWWRVKRQAAKRNAPALPADADVLRIGYSAKKLPSDIDHIIIGSGLSGLYLAALLSKLGRKVLVLEQHYVAGGCTHTFKDKGYEFDTGVHYVGQERELTAMMDFAAGRQGAFTMSQIGAENDTKMYNEIQVGKNKYYFRPGKENFIGDLVAKFPGEEAAIRRFFREAASSSNAMSLVAAKQYMPSFLWSALLSVPGPVRCITNRYMKRTLSTVLKECGIKNDELKAVLSSEFGDYATVPDEAPFFLHAGILGHYIQQGAFYPTGGSDAFAEVLMHPILESGGSVLVRAPVSKIIVENGCAVGVEVKGKDIIKAKCSVISSAGVEVTYRKLLNEVDVQKMGGPPQSLLATEKKGSAHHVYGFIGLDGTSKELGLPTHNIWSFPSWGKDATPDLTAVWKSLTSDKDKLPGFLTDDAATKVDMPCFLSFPSAKDPLYDSRCPGKSTAVVLTESRVEFFGTPGPMGKRGDAYDKVKESYKELLLNAFHRHFPHLKSKVAYVDIGTPWSNEHYLGHPGSYGLDQDVDRFLDHSLQMAPRNVRGLYMTGQDYLCCGIFPQPLIAWITLSKVLGISSLDFWLLFGDFACSFLWRMLPGALPARQ